jgi:hypothetical protein
MCVCVAVVSCTVSDAWWPLEAPFTKDAVGLNYVSTTSAGLTVSLPYRGTSLIRTPPPSGPYSSPMPGDLW